MKLINKTSLSQVIISLLLLMGYAIAEKSLISEKSLGLRKTSLYNENKVVPNKTDYRKGMPGATKTIKRAYQDAPPMIPHSVEGLLPITANNNQCIACHAPEVAPSLNALPYPKSHMINFRPKTTLAKDGEVQKNGEIIKNTSSEKQKYITIQELNTLSKARFNCSQCHAPQSKTKLTVKNTFIPDYASKNGTKKSSWKGSKLTEGLNTLMQ